MGSDLRVLQLATSPRSFFENQVREVEKQGVDCETLVVPRSGEDGRGPTAYLRFYLRILREGTLGSFDIIHANYGLIGPLSLLQPTRPVVLTLWGSDLMGPAWLQRVSQLSTRFSDCVIVPTRVLSRRLSIPHEYIPFGIDTDLFTPEHRDDARAKIGWSTDERVVLFPYDPDRGEKNYPLAERVVSRVPNTTLRAVTGAPYEQMPTYMNASDALIVTSDRESGPLSVCEAISCGLPVVSRDVGFVSDVLDGVAGCAVANSEDELVSALMAVLDAQQRVREPLARRYQLDRLGQEIVRVYQKVLN